MQIEPFAPPMAPTLTDAMHQIATLVPNRITAEHTSNSDHHPQSTDELARHTRQLVDGSVSLDIEVSNEISEAVVITEGTGLERMKMRARSLGGWADYASADGRFIVLASVPLALPKQK